MRLHRSRFFRALLSVLLLGGLLGVVLGAATSREAAGRNVPNALDESVSGVLTNDLGMRLMLIPGGSFQMGSPLEESGRLANEGPAHTVYLSRAFYMGATEVTTGQFEAFVRETGYRSDAERDAGGGFGIDFETGQVRQQKGITWRAPGFPGFVPGPNHPVILVSWQDAEAFCHWLSQREGRVYRLPTEAEWEYAARAGSDSAYAHGDARAALQGRANVADESLRTAAPSMKQAEAWNDGFPFLAPVASFAPNAFGLYDMHGNVWEWCADWYRPAYHVTSPRIDPEGPRGGSFRSIRGGGWFNPAAQNRSAQRVYFDPRFRYCLLSGFRVVAEVAGP